MPESYKFTRTKRNPSGEKPTYTYIRLENGIRVIREYSGSKTIQHDFLVGDHFITRTGKHVVMTKVNWVPESTSGCYVVTTGNPVSLQNQIDIIYDAMTDDTDLATGLVEPAEQYIEGSSEKVWVNRYERDSRARQKCLDELGYKCQICGFDFEKRYGFHGKNFIEVHHIKPLHTLGKGYKVNPVKDLIPVCSNCHSMLHRGGVHLSVEDLREMVKTT